MFSLHLVEKIQTIVKKNTLLLHTAANEPYLENSCCETNDNQKALDYFSSKDPTIIEYNNIVS